MRKLADHLVRKFCGFLRSEKECQYGNARLLLTFGKSRGNYHAYSFLYVIDFDMEVKAPTAALETAIIFVREEEQKRIVKLFREKVVPNLVAAMFEAQSVKEELEWKGFQKNEAISRMIERLANAVSGIESIADLEHICEDPELAALLNYPVALETAAP